MKKVLVCCNTGVTTSMLVTKIERVAKTRGLEISIEASPISTAVDHIAQADVVLLGPQVGFAKTPFEEAGAKNVKVISTEDYATQNAESILDGIEADLKEA